MRVEVVRPDGPTWPAFLAELDHDVYHLPGYVALSARLAGASDEATPQALIARDGDRAMFLPVVVRAVPGAPGWRDAISPYGYPGPLVLGAEDPPFRAAASASIIDHLRRERVVSLFVRMHPLLNREVDGFENVGAIVEHGQTVSIDLRAPADALWAATRSGHRNEINRAIRSGARAFLDEEWSHESD